jgi:hypothetical protein
VDPSVVIVFALQVLQLLYTSGNIAWAAGSFGILFTQFFLVYARVLPYLFTTFGLCSPQYLGFLLFGFPVGLLLFDCLMFLEPFGLLSVLPLPASLRLFIPSYKATRIIFEVAAESVPQSVLQG